MTNKIKICPFYKSSRKCINNNSCINQLISNNSVCSSDLYYSMDLEQQLERKEKECEKLKEKVMELRQGYDEEDCTTTCINMQYYERQNKKYEQALEEIRKIANEMRTECWYKDNECDTCHLDVDGCEHFARKLILEKCNEVLNNE